MILVDVELKNLAGRCIYTNAGETYKIGSASETLDKVQLVRLLYGSDYHCYKEPMTVTMKEAEQLLNNGRLI